MSHRLLGSSLTALIVTAGITCAVQAQQVQPAQNNSPANKILAHALDVETGRAIPRPYEPRLSSGLLYTIMSASGELDRNAQRSLTPVPSFDVIPRRSTAGCSNVYSSGSTNNTRVNQDCSRRRQAEEVLAVNPTDPDNLIAGQNDARLGISKCAYDFSTDGGKTWSDMVAPFYQFVLKDGHTADACSDPTVTFDSAGNAFIAGLLVDAFAPANALIVMKSNAGLDGGFFHSPADVPFQTFRDTPVGVIANDNDPNIINDKPLITADSHLGSIKKNNLYVTWTRVNSNTGAGVGFNQPISFSQSLDGGSNWSTPIEISGASANCVTLSAETNPNACDQDEGSDPVVGPDGTLYVTFGNFNTAGTTIPPGTTGQIMIVSCPMAADCSKAASWTAPVKVADTFDGQPVGPNAGCLPTLACLPPNSYRVTDSADISLSVDNGGRLLVAFSDFRNGKANCTGPNAAPPCDNDVFYVFSTDHGATWSSARKLTPAGSAQWQPWSAVSPDGSKLFVAYYDRSYGNCELTGCNDITLAVVENPTSAAPSVDYHRITTSSMPNLTQANNPIEATFLGDYMGITVDSQGRPNMVWADTRGLNGTVEEDVYFSRVQAD
jgi:hypothetical protein